MIITIVKTCLLAICFAGMAACGAARPPTNADGHLNADMQDIPDSVPQLIKQSPKLPVPKPRLKLETYTVVVNDVPVRELLFSMARDAKLNLDIDNDITGKVTLNAIDQTLPQILHRLSRQVAIGYIVENNYLHVTADKPYLHTYKVDYLNISRTSTGQVTISTEVASTGGGASQDDSGGSSASTNDSSTSLTSSSENQFWQTLTANIVQIISEDASAATAGATSRNVIVNRESGLITVRTTYRQHAQVQQYIDDVVNSAKRQVLIEATIAEVQLSDRYQAGINWSLITGSASSGVNINQNVTGEGLSEAPFFSFTVNELISGDPLSATLTALEEFGDVNVLSSPKIIALNNQTAILKVVDNAVYFTIEVEVTAGTASSASTQTIETVLHSIPVGIVMSVTPYISENDVVTLNVRPTISRIIDFVNDPNPTLANAGVVSKIPVVRVREIESVLTINNGDTAIIGGLMQDTVDKSTVGVPILSSLPLIGDLFSFRDDQHIKSELVIFLRPIVTKNASLSGDLRDYRQYLPNGKSN